MFHFVQAAVKITTKASFKIETKWAQVINTLNLSMKKLIFLRIREDLPNLRSILSVFKFRKIYAHLSTITCLASMNTLH